MSDDNVIPLKLAADSPVARKAEADATINDIFSGLFGKSKLGEIKDIERRLDNIEWRLNRTGSAA